MRKRDPEAETAAIVKSGGVDEDTVRTAGDHAFMLKHDLEKGCACFDPDYDIAQSWQRLTSGVGVLPHDITLIRHEAYEAALMSEGVPYSGAHDATQLVYDYAEELKELSRGGDGACDDFVTFMGLMPQRRGVDEKLVEFVRANPEASTSDVIERYCELVILGRD